MSMRSAKLRRLPRAEDWREISQADRSGHLCQGSVEGESRADQGQAGNFETEDISVKGYHRLGPEDRKSHVSERQREGVRPSSRVRESSEQLDTSITHSRKHGFWDIRDPCSGRLLPIPLKLHDRRQGKKEIASIPTQPRPTNRSRT